MHDVGSRWDWYAATIDDLEEGQLGTSLALIFGARVERTRGRNGYAIGSQVTRDGSVLATVYERSARSGEVHVEVTSEACDEVVPVLRRHHPVHRVTRADSAVDFAADFAALDARVVAFAKGRGISHRLFSDSDGGSTRYVGSPRSEAMLRVYKKSEQLRALHPERASTVPDGIVRFELVVRPGKREAKEALSLAGPDDAWGFAKWTREVGALMLGLDAERTATHFRRPTDDERAMHFLIQQYGGMMRRRALQHGVDAFLAELVERAALDALTASETASPAG